MSQPTMGQSRDILPAPFFDSPDLGFLYATEDP